MLGIQIVIDTILIYAVIRLWVETRRLHSEVPRFARESREAMETYRDEFEDLLDRLERRVAEERRAVEEMVAAKAAKSTIYGPDRISESRGRPSAVSMLKVGCAESFEREGASGDGQVAREEVWNLRDKGFAVDDIARKTGAGTREVRLILAMKEEAEGS